MIGQTPRSTRQRRERRAQAIRLRGRAGLCLVGLLLVGGSFAVPAAAATRGTAARPSGAPPAALQLEVVGQVTSSAPTVSPATSVQYGYLSAIRGVVPVFTPGPWNETTAIYTFFTDATTTMVIGNGPLKIIDREGTTTIYRRATPGAQFSAPATFKDGMPIQVSTLHQQVIIDTLAGVFTTMNLNTITATVSFTVNGRAMRLGTVGGTFRTVLSGHLNAPAPPSGYFAGYAATVSGPASPHSD